MTKEITKEDVWTVEDSENLYRVALWGESYFYVNEEGHLAVRPILGDSIGIDVYKVVQDLKQQRIQFPLLIRFQDLLRSRVAEINTAFRRAIEESGYGNSYIGVYPIKVNQLHEVVQEILEAGRPFGFGLESGSRAESGGDRSKFGITITELVKLIDEVSATGLSDGFKLLHFHMGSQILDIQNLKQAVKEIVRIYATLRKRGLEIEYLNVGGGLGVN